MREITDEEIAMKTVEIAAALGLTDKPDAMEKIEYGITELVINHCPERSAQPMVIKPLRGDALLCKNNGWKVGDKLVGDEGYGDTIILLTAIGEEHISAKPLSHDGKPSNANEGHWTLSCRKWRKAL